MTGENTFKGPDRNIADKQSVRSGERRRGQVAGQVVNSNVVELAAKAAIVEQNPNWILPGVIADFQENVGGAGADDFLGDADGGEA